MGNSLSFITISNILQLKKEKHEKSEKIIVQNHNLKNPGTVEDIHKDCRSVLPHTYRGARIVINKYLSNHFLASHILNIMPNIKSGNYKFGVSYVGNTKSTKEGSFPLLFGEIQKDGTMDSNIIHYFSNRIRVKFGGEYIGKQLDCYQMSIDYLGETFSGSIGLANIDLRNNTGIIVGQYLQSITEHLAFGSEIGLNMKYNGVDNFNIINFISKYKTNNFTLSTSVGANGFFLTYVRSASSNLKIAVEISSDFRTSNNTLTTLGYEYQIPKTNFLFRASIDTKYNICSVFQKKLQELPYATFSISTKLNQKSGKFSLGCGIVIS